MTTANSTAKPLSRRLFLKGASLGLGIPVVGTVLVARGADPAAQSPTAAATDHDTTATPQGQSGGTTADQMDAMHEAGIKAFLAGVKTEGQGNQPLQPRLDNGVKVFELTS